MTIPDSSCILNALVYHYKVNSENTEFSIDSTLTFNGIDDQFQNKNLTIFDNVKQELQDQVENLQEKAAALKAAFIRALGESLVDSFSFRTCVEPKLTFFSDKNEYKIRYTSLTASTS